ncbi:hypothetical protein NDU88_007068 [Pleurodeles waltl]|uniref:Uncharacterized protein n=1 Tax=Pleurodeles waltl TaxID=8319 RepID=A0AAV7MEW8_PLEWA|nr:hypothetical protein NDU88_007068 [Pleurodeles waltl]
MVQRPQTGITVPLNRRRYSRETGASRQVESGKHLFLCNPGRDSRAVGRAAHVGCPSRFHLHELTQSHVPVLLSRRLLAPPRDVLCARRGLCAPHVLSRARPPGCEGTPARALFIEFCFAG